MTLALRDFLLGALGLFLLLRVVGLLSGEPWLALAWQDVALPIGMALIFAAFRHRERAGK